MENQIAQVAEQIERIVERLNVDAVFGEVRREGDVAIIPVVQVGTTFGFGYGSGESPSQVEERLASGGGGGGGGMGSAKPRGFIKFTPDGVHFEPTANPFMIPLAGIAMIAWSVFWITWTVRAFVRR
ncbi:MAG TPA: spore germination protein GerW family protein [Anaerolineae bacterium]|nr:spore germination protein GerW family protein [Anaerolineae bacterium]HNU05651.1 spore germination protein GerW family protein [Anaerolineae bacterium]